jgi:hypothetical protein
VPTVLRQDGFDVMMYTNDHGPPHVHVWKAGGEIVINLAPVEIARAEGMKRQDAARAVEIVEEYRDDLLERWHEIHG